MSPMRVTARRTFDALRRARGTALAIALFLAASASALVFHLAAAEGGSLSLPVIWTLSVSQVLPILAAFLAMDTFCEERRTGRLDMLLCVAVRERDIAVGKFLGVWFWLLVSVALALVVQLPILWHYAPLAFKGLGASAFVPGLMALAVEGMLWSALSVMMSALCRRAALAAAASVLLLVLLPRGVWEALRLWSPQGGMSFGEMTLDAMTIDFASGILPLVTTASFLLLTMLSLFLASRALMLMRLPGCRTRMLRLMTRLSMLLAVVLAVLAVAFAARFESTLEWPSVRTMSRFSPRMRRLLADASRPVSATCFLARDDARFRAVARLLRALKRESDAIDGMGMSLRFIDPQWDVGSSARLVRAHVPEGSIVFGQGRRMAFLPVADCANERALVATLQRVLSPPQRHVVYWTTGHGEGSFSDYGPWGYSDIARDLYRSGYSNKTIDLASNAHLPADCAMLVVAGAKDDFSRTERTCVEAYLKGGGRLLALVGPSVQGGVMSLLPAWGLLPALHSFAAPPSLSGTDVIVSEFGTHAVSAQLKGSRIVLDKPLVFAPSSAVANGAGADRIAFSSLASLGAHSVAAATERGAGVGSDLSLRPTRVVVIGDATCVMNRPLVTRANANRDFFLNAIAYLAGTETPGASGQTQDVFVTGISRATRLRLSVCVVFLAPMAVWLLFAFVHFIRRHRT